MSCHHHAGMNVGVVIEKNCSNQGLATSAHTRHLLKLYHDVYYVLFPNEGRLGPYNASELSLVQSGPSSTTSNIDK